MGPRRDGQLPRASERFRLPSAAETPAPPNDVAARDRHRRAADARARLQLLGVAARRPRLPLDRGSRARRRQDFSGHSVLLDFTCGRDNPAIALYRRRDPRRMRRSATTSATIADVPSRSLLSRLTDHYMQIIANRAPIGFEAEFDNPARRDHLLSRHPDALLVGRRDDRLHLRRDQLEDVSAPPSAAEPSELPVERPDEAARAAESADAGG